MKELRLHGRGGQGIVVGGEILSNAFLNEGKYLAVMPSYGVERRGSDVTAYYEADLSFCKGCGVCSYECPKKAINMRLDSEFEQ